MLAHFAHHLLTALPVPLLPMIRDNFTLNYTQSGLVLSAFTLSYGISNLPAGWLADRIGRRILLVIGISGVALAGLLVGISQTYIMMLVFLVLMGMAGGSYHPTTPPLISSLVEPEKRGQAMGLHVTGGSASYFLAPLIAVAIASAWGWRSPFIVLAVPTFIFGIVLYVILGRWAQKKEAKHRRTSIHEGATTASPVRWRRLVALLT